MLQIPCWELWSQKSNKDLCAQENNNVDYVAEGVNWSEHIGGFGGFFYLLMIAMPKEDYPMLNFVQVDKHTCELEEYYTATCWQFTHCLGNPEIIVIGTGRIRIRELLI